MSNRIAPSLAAVALAAWAAAASAQTTVAPNPDPAKVGVTQSTAIDAENKAVPRSDTGTLVHTGKARRSMAAASSADGSMATSNGTTNAGSMGTASASNAETIDNAEPTAAGRRARHAATEPRSYAHARPGGLVGDRSLSLLESRGSDPHERRTCSGRLSYGVTKARDNQATVVPKSARSCSPAFRQAPVSAARPTSHSTDAAWHQHRRGRLDRWARVASPLHCIGKCSRWQRDCAAVCRVRAPQRSGGDPGGAPIEGMRLAVAAHRKTRGPHGLHQPPTARSQSQGSLQCGCRRASATDRREERDLFFLHGCQYRRLPSRPADERPGGGRFRRALAADRLDSHTHAEVAQNPLVWLFFQGSGHAGFASLHGRATVSRDKSTIKRLWKPIMKTWFTEGEDDPRIRAISVAPVSGYYWDNKHGDLVAGAKMAIGAAIGMTLDDSIEGTLSF